jgi:hypothetical protein
MMRAAKLGWVGLCILILAVSLYLGDPGVKRDIDIFLVWSMLVLCFPSSGLIVLLFAGASYLLYQHFSIAPSAERATTFYAYLFLTWLAFFVVGYIQWFKLLPYLIAKLRARKKTITT